MRCATAVSNTEYAQRASLGIVFAINDLMVFTKHEHRVWVCGATRPRLEGAHGIPTALCTYVTV
jgi:hypothetical protein